MTAAVYTFGAVIYCVLASGSIQPWAVESVVLHASEMQVQLELNRTNTLLDRENYSSVSAQKAASEHYENSDLTASSLLQVGN